MAWMISWVFGHGAEVVVTDGAVRSGASPYNWMFHEGAMASTVCGASLSVQFQGTRRVVVRLGAEGMSEKLPASRMPIVGWTVNGGELRTAQVERGGMELLLTAGVTDPKIDLFIRGMSPFEDRWNGDVPVNALRIRGFLVDEGARAVALPQPNRVWWNIGDSIMSGDGAAYGAKRGRPHNDRWAESDDARASYGYLLATALGYRESRLAFGGYNWKGGLAKVAHLKTLVDRHSSGLVRFEGDAIDPRPEVVLINLGTNGVPQLEDVVESLEKVRLRVGKAARVIVMVPLSGAARARVTEAFEAYRQSSADRGTHLLDLGKIEFETCDGVHPTAAGHKAVFEMALPRIKALIGE
jgi:lysophospholipase L1-like esterase